MLCCSMHAAHAPAAPRPCCASIAQSAPRALTTAPSLCTARARACGRERAAQEEAGRVAARRRRLEHHHRDSAAHAAQRQAAQEEADRGGVERVGQRPEPGRARAHGGGRRGVGGAQGQDEEEPQEGARTGFESQASRPEQLGCSHARALPWTAAKPERRGRGRGREHRRGRRAQEVEEAQERGRRRRRGAAQGEGAEGAEEGALLVQPNPNVNPDPDPKPNPDPNPNPNPDPNQARSSYILFAMEQRKDAEIAALPFAEAGKAISDKCRTAARTRAQHSPPTHFPPLRRARRPYQP